LWGRYIAGRGGYPQLGQDKCSGRDIAQMSDVLEMKLGKLLQSKNETRISKLGEK
jgi:hypothetical protein